MSDGEAEASALDARRVRDRPGRRTGFLLRVHPIHARGGHTRRQASTSMSHPSTCCDTAASLTATADALAADAADPTLQSCCARDLAQQASSARLAATLAAADRVGAAARAATRAAVTPPSGDSDDGNHLASLRATRLAQLKAAAAAAADAGPPGVRDVASAAAVAHAAEAAAPGPTVAHVAAPGYGAGDALDELLTTLAAEYRGTVFVRWAPRDGAKTERPAATPHPGRVSQWGPHSSHLHSLSVRWRWRPGRGEGGGVAARGARAGAAAGGRRCVTLSICFLRVGGRRRRAQRPPVRSVWPHVRAHARADGEAGRGGGRQQQRRGE